MYLYIVIVGLLSTPANAYILLQVSKDGQNRSSIDAFVHKVVPSRQYGETAAKFAREQLTDAEATKKLQEAQSTKTVSSGNRIGDSVQEFLHKKPDFRSKSLRIKPIRIKFRSKPSVVYQVDSSGLLHAIEDVLASRTVSKYAEEMARKAAFIYHTLKESK